MEIVITDGYTLNPGDQSWEALKQFGTLTVFDRTAENEIVDRCRDAEIILTNKVPFNAETLSKLPNLRLISVLATGYNIIDLQSANENNIIVCNVPAYGTASVAQHVFALILELTNHVAIHDASVKSGDWQSSIDFAYTIKPIHELAGKTLGIIGFGDIGRQVARIGNAFDMDAIFFNPSRRESDFARSVSLNDVIRNSDYLTLHCPLKVDNREFVNASLLTRMKKTAFIINTARGQLINEQDLADALDRGTIAGAGLDVLSTEPPTTGNPLLNAKNCIITPHNAWISVEARKRIIEITIRNIQGYLTGTTVNKVN